MSPSCSAPDPAAGQRPRPRSRSPSRSRSRDLSCLLLAALFLPAAASAETAAPAGEVLVDRVVAVVEGGRGSGEEAVIVTLFELDVEARLVVAERARSIDAALADPPDSLRVAVLRTVVDQILIQREAARLELASVSDEDVERERAALEARLGGPGSLDEFMARTGAPLDLLGEIVLRRATVTRFVARNVALAVLVTDADVEAAYREGGHPFEGRPLEEVREEMEALVVARRQRERLAAWLEELRARSRVRFISE